MPVGSGIAVAAAGNVHMAGFLTWKIASDPSCETGDIRALRDRAQDIARAAADEYFQKYPNNLDARCSLLIGGTGSKSQKRARIKDRLAALVAAANRLNEETIAQLEGACV